MDERVSIIVPVYNVEKYIAQTIESVLAQTVDSWELILIDDCSTDNSAEVIRRYADKDGGGRIRLVRQPSNTGAAGARNRGLRESTGRYVAYLDADDLWVPRKLERELAFLRETGAAFVFTGYEFANEQARGTGKVVRVPRTLNYRQALSNTTIFTSTVMFDTEKIQRSRLEMPAVKSEDTALWWKVLKSGVTAYGLDENLVLYRRPARSLSSNKLEAVRRIWNLYRRTEGLGLFASLRHFLFWAVRAVKRRV